jgi:hypothetical protein
MGRCQRRGTAGNPLMGYRTHLPGIALDTCAFLPNNNNSVGM